MINNLKLEWGDKSLDYLNGEPYRTRVVLKNEDGAYYPVFFEPEAINKPSPELLKMAIDVVYNKNFSQRAEDERFNLLGTKIAEVDKAIEASKTQSATSQKALMDVVFLFYSKGLLTDEDIASFTLA
ncbi:Protein of uncharacterised function (DUF1366) [Streptococcus pseudoporcinus]|uniref:Protein of uncharacterized function (DUF1366) n=1 Tax=Streptococcus pseudoporcinus TaxID=361101 RepID=A0A4U9XLF2_9STRE|nr:DUF1366 domain-containing protein [Streptococcus pseudoporcinus]VTS14204.1 Protein of uncharacterised function (DUF1366) [Streptococcus pseudoporcinus]